MRFEILLAPQAARMLRDPPARLRAEIKDALGVHLRHEPRRVSKSRIKRLKGMAKPKYRLRVGEMRVFYDVQDEAVEILAIVAKDQVHAWLGEEGISNANGGSGEGEG